MTSRERWHPGSAVAGLVVLLLAVVGLAMVLAGDPDENRRVRAALTWPSPAGLGVDADVGDGDHF